jgi:putative FmdB family regulatory protein
MPPTAVARPKPVPGACSPLGLPRSVRTPARTSVGQRCNARQPACVAALHTSASTLPYSPAHLRRECADIRTVWRRPQIEQSGTSNAYATGAGLIRREDPARLGRIRCRMAGTSRFARFLSANLWCHWPREECVMPTYEYECASCGHRFERRQTITADPITFCPGCGGKVHRLLSGGAGVLVKGRERHAARQSDGGCSFEREGATCCGRQERCDRPSCEGH